MVALCCLILSSTDPENGVGEIGRCQWKCGAGPARSGQAQTVPQLPTAAASTLTLHRRNVDHHHQHAHDDDDDDAGLVT